jgi:hypothetical protein
MKVKTNELSGAALDWAVAKCEQDDTVRIYFDEDTGEKLCHKWFPILGQYWDVPEFSPSTDWAQGGLIIERERIYLQPEIGKEGAGNAWYAVSMYNTDAYGSTPLIAAMRCYVASKLGDEVEVHDELLENEQ